MVFGKGDQGLTRFFRDCYFTNLALVGDLIQTQILCQQAGHCRHRFKSETLPGVGVLCGTNGVQPLIGTDIEKDKLVFDRLKMIPVETSIGSLDIESEGRVAEVCLKPGSIQGTNRLRPEPAPKSEVEGFEPLLQSTPEAL